MEQFDALTSRFAMQQCPPPTPDPCAPICPPPEPLPPCRPKPIMRGLHWAQTQRILAQGFTLCALAGTTFYFLIKRPRRAAYKDFYAKGEFEDWAEEMARKGLFQSVPKESLPDNKHMRK